MAVLRPSLMRLWLGAALVLTPPAVLAQAPSAPASPGGAAPVVAEPSTKGAPAAAAKAGPAPEESSLKAERSAKDRELVENWQDPTLEMAEEAEPESLGWTLMRTLLVLGAVVASIYLTLNVGLRRLMGLQAVASGRQPLVTVVERLPLDQRRSLFVVKAAGEYLLVGGGEAGLQLLSKLDSEAVERIRSERPPTNVVPLSPFLQKLLSRRSGGSPSQPPGA